MIMNSSIIAINIGQPTAITHQKKQVLTGIYKTPIQEPVYLNRTNFAGDQQADLVNHGGPDKAVCVYAHEHYPYWEQELSSTLEFGAFGENLTTQGLLEQDVCIGDVFMLGEAVVQVSQPRQPCYKLSVKHDRSDMPLLVQNKGLTGFYFRVIEEGWVSKDSPLNRIHDHQKGITVAFANQIMYHNKKDISGIKALLEVKELAESWRKVLTKRLK
jgi:MOSC domain-containing protein YiiM